MQKIAESELIINKRGAIYHLDLRPEELAGTVIVVGDPDRVKKVSKHLGNLFKKAKSLQNKKTKTPSQEPKIKTDMFGTVFNSLPSIMH